jgi:hypothetical protein
MKRKNHHHIINHSARRSSNPKMRHRKMFKMNIDSHYDREEEKEEPVSKNRKTLISKTPLSSFLNVAVAAVSLSPVNGLKDIDAKSIVR